ncbi:MAG TPA: hypothetical protein VF287_06870 [Usitatibacter sp.]
MREELARFQRANLELRDELNKTSLQLRKAVGIIRDFDKAGAGVGLFLREAGK